MSSLLTTPLFAVTLTVGVYWGAQRLYARWRSPLLNPLLVTIAVLVAVLSALRIDFSTYDAGGRLLAFFLGPSVVALGVPLAEQWPAIWAQRRALFVSLLAGSVVGVVAGTATALALGASEVVVLSVAPRSVTTPIAIGIAAALGGAPSLTAGFVIASGLLGAVAGPTVLRLLRIHSPTAWGLAMGASAHGIGTVRALEEGATQGAASGLAIGLCGVATAALAPATVALLRLVWAF